MSNYRIEKQTNNRWANLYNVSYKDKTGRSNKWTVISRKDNPITDADNPDAVVIIPIIKTIDGNRLVITKEFRVPIWDWEYGFPAGLIEPEHTIEQMVAKELKEETGLDLVKIVHTSMPVYSTAGLSDESNLMVLAFVAGKVSDEYLEPAEQIETMLMDVDDIRQLLKSKNKVAAKAWGLLYHFAATGRIDFDCF